MVTFERRGDRIVVTLSDGTTVQVPQDLPIQDWSGRVFDKTAGDAYQDGTLRVVDDDERGESSFGLHGVLYYV